MSPIAFEIGPFSIHWYGILITLAFFIGILGITHQAQKAEMNVDDVLTTLLWMIPMSIIGARLYYVLFEWSYYSTHPAEIIAVWQGGLAVHGGLIAGVITMAICSKYLKFSAMQLADIAAPFMILGQGIGRWGNYFNQEAYGYPVDPDQWPLAMYIDGAWRHPTFLYESVWDVVGFIVLLLYGRKKDLPKGQVALLYVMYYSFGRFWIEGFRTDSLMLGPLRMAQVISLVAFAIALILWLYNHKKQRV